MPKVHRTLCHVGKLPGAGHGEADGSGTAEWAAEADGGFAELLGELAAALDPALDLRAGLYGVSCSIGADGATARCALVPPLWNLGPSIPVPPFGTPVSHLCAEPAPSGERAYAGGLARCDTQGREARTSSRVTSRRRS
ncbi:hypothetical protein [Streptomyces sp. NPDC055107]